MNNYFRDELISIIDTWTVEQLDGYIKELEERIKHNKEQLSYLRIVRKRKSTKVPKDSGVRGAV